MNQPFARRNFVKSLLFAPAISKIDFSKNKPKSNTIKLKPSLNAYSFNDPLKAKTMDLMDVLDFCSKHNFEGVDLTGYYFPNYPSVPSDEYIFKLKHRAHKLGLSISGTGIKNDFTNPDASKRKEDIQLIKNWIEVAAKLGAPVIRIFSGVMNPKGYTWDEIAQWMAKDIQECVAYGQKHGVIVAIQNHNDFIQTGDDVVKLMKLVNMEWFGLILDIGSFHQGDPYAQILQTIPYAVNWQIKEKMYENGIEVKTDLKRIFQIIKASTYRGFIPVETLGQGDPAKKVAIFIQEVIKALK